MAALPARVRLRRISSLAARTTPTALGVALLVCSVTVGCGKSDRIPTFATTGRATFQGKPIEGAFLVLHPQQKPEAHVPSPTALVAADGTFKATTFETGDGAPVGEYVVTAEWRKLVKQNGDWVPGPNLLPAAYADPAKSPLRVTVLEGENPLHELAIR